MTKLISSGSEFEKSVGYSRAVVKGSFCFVSGTTGYDYETMKMPESVADQARNCLNTIEATLDEGGFQMSDVVRVQYTIVDSALYEELAPVLGEVFSEIRPAATMVVAGLIRPEMKVEIEVTAMKS
ncbi:MULTISPECIES: RidA family protein [Halocynthiibacter]|uniref:RidA family protein n=1 Tax=Halocynthiibacter halioticoli TaxID=2986804 RepID=A0AAE3J1G1_9RHOB|nr:MULTISPECIES: RidA family protein [Halocynthiibacter]MCV6825604.1 RidA family protein [Halocynthiibacter halioticoli]MCW4058605.1 RidA family protein [Halocynthiibacter sp. SDUM655004]